MKTIRNKLDFNRRADLCFNFLTRMTDEKLDLLPYWLIAIDENPAWACHYRVDDSELPGSWAEALIRLRQMTGDDQGLRTEQAFKKMTLRDFGEDGLRYHHKYPWTRTIFCNYHEMAYFTSLFAAWYEDEPDNKEMVAKARGLIRALRKVAAEKKEITYWSGNFPQQRKSYSYEGDSYYQGKGYDKTRWTGRGEESIRNAIMISGLVRWAELTGDEAAMDLAEGMINHVVYESRKFGYEQQYTAHVHSTMWITTGVIHYGILTGNKELIKWGRGVYEYTRKHSSAFGWVPEYIGWRDPREEFCETCCIKDMIESALMLIRAGYTEYWEDIDRFSRNHLCESQFDQADAIAVDNSKPDTVEYTWKDIGERAVGGFSGGTEVNSLSISRFRSLAGCCMGTAPQAFYFVWLNSVTEKDDGIHVNLPNDRETGSVNVFSHHPEQARLDIAMKKDAKALFVRIAPWAENRVHLTVDGKDMPPIWIGNEIVVREPKKGMQIIVQHANPAVRRKEDIRGTTYDIDWVGNTVYNVYPKGDPIRLYQRGPKPPKGDGLKIPAPTQWSSLTNLQVDSPE